MICWLDIEKPSDKWRRVKKKKKKDYERKVVDKGKERNGDERLE